MKKLLPLVLSFLALTGLKSQISITANMPSSIPAGTSVDAEVKINKGAIGNFAKYQMDVPAGYSVSGVEVQSGNFTFENQRAKIVWVSVPSDPEFTVKFKITGDASATNQGAIVQKFFYLENNEKKEVEGNTITLGGGVASTTSSGSTPVETVASTSSSGSSTSSTPVETVKSTPVETVKSEPVETVKSTPVETVKSTPVETVKSTPVETTKTTTSSSSASMEGYTYKVQLGAYSAEPSKSKFAAAGSVSIDMVDGLYKVTSGNFKTKEDAMKHRDALQGKGYTGFIVTYKNGQRVK